MMIFMLLFVLIRACFVLSAALGSFSYLRAKIKNIGDSQKSTKIRSNRGYEQKSEEVFLHETRCSCLMDRSFVFSTQTVYAKKRC